MTRDDRDRLLVVGGIVWQWFGFAFATGTMPSGPAAAAYFGWVLGLPVVAVLAALALWRNVAAARWPLFLIGLAQVAAAALVLDRPALAIVLGGGGLAIAIGASRIRIPPERIESRGAGGRGTEGARTTRLPSDAADDPQLHALLDAAAHLDRERTRVLSAAWRVVDPEARREAWNAVRRELDRTRRAAVLDEVRREIELWGRAAGGSPWTWEWATMTDVDRSDVRRGAMPALLDAAAATLLRDRLDAATLDVLMVPWEAASGAPATDNPQGEPATS